MQVPQTEVALADGMIVQFGLMTTRFRISYLPVNLCPSRLTIEERASLEMNALIVGAHVLNAWSPLCTHLVINKLEYSPKLFRALIDGKWIVNSAWLAELRNLPSPEAAIPDPLLFPPAAVDDPVLRDFTRGRPVSLQPTEARKQIFRGKKFVFLSGSLFETYHGILEYANAAAAVDASHRAIDLSFLCDFKTFHVVDPAISYPSGDAGEQGLSSTVSQTSSIASQAPAVDRTALAKRRVVEACGFTLIQTDDILRTILCATSDFLNDPAKPDVLKLREALANSKRPGQKPLPGTSSLSPDTFVDEDDLVLAGSMSLLSSSSTVNTTNAPTITTSLSLPTESLQQQRIRPSSTSGMADAWTAAPAAAGPVSGSSSAVFSQGALRGRSEEQGPFTATSAAAARQAPQRHPQMTVGEVREALQLPPSVAGSVVTAYAPLIRTDSRLHSPRDLPDGGPEVEDMEERPLIRSSASSSVSNGARHSMTDDGPNFKKFRKNWTPGSAGLFASAVAPPRSVAVPHRVAGSDSAPGRTLEMRNEDGADMVVDLAGEHEGPVDSAVDGMHVDRDVPPATEEEHHQQQAAGLMRVEEEPEGPKRRRMEFRR